jgi:hypothetical protein
MWEYMDSPPATITLMFSGDPLNAKARRLRYGRNFCDGGWDTFFAGLGQSLNNIINTGIGSLLDHLLWQARYRIGGFNDRQICQPFSLGNPSCFFHKTIRHHCYDGSAELFNPDGVADTPRRT